MKILQLYPYYPPAWEYGGALRVVHQLATRFAERNHDVTVFTTDTHGKKGRVDAADHVDAGDVDVQYFPNLSNRVTRILNFPMPVGIRCALRNTGSEFDIIHIHGFPHLMAVWGARAARQHSVPYIVTPHGSINQPHEVRPPLFRRLFYWMFSTTILTGASAVTALTDDEKHRLASVDVRMKRIVQIPNGINPEEVSEKSGAEFRSQHNLNNQRVVGFIGRLHHKKGLDIVIECAEYFKDKRDICFIIIGPDDGYEDKLRNQIRKSDLDNVSLLGYISENKKQAALKTIDVFLHPSYAEGQPIAVLEACAAGTPVVISDQCALPEISRARAGIVTAPETTAVISAINHVLMDANLRREMGQNGRRLVEENFSWEQVLNEYETLYNNVVDGYMCNTNHTDSY